MSQLTVTTVATANTTTNLTLKTGNTSGPQMIIPSGNGVIQANGDFKVTGNTIFSGDVQPYTHAFRNKIINGNFDIWQRGTSTTSAGYQADRWYTGNTGTTFTTSRQTFTLGQTDVPNEPTYYHRTVTSSSAGAGNYCYIVQKVESVRTLAGQSATLTFWAKADSSKNIAVEFAQDFGSGGSPSSSVTGIGVTTCALTSSWTKFTVPVSLSSISGKTAGTTHDGSLQIVFWFDAGSTYNSRTNSLGQQSGTFDIAQVQLEKGSNASNFEVRPIGVEQGLCERYYQRYDNDGGTGSYLIFSFYSTTGSLGYSGGLLRNKMRAQPTVTKNGTWGVSNCGQPSFSSSSTAFQVQAIVTTTGAAIVYTNSSDDTLVFDAEL